MLLDYSVAVESSTGAWTDEPGYPSVKSLGVPTPTFCSGMTRAISEERVPKMIRKMIRGISPLLIALVFSHENSVLRLIHHCPGSSPKGWIFGICNANGSTYDNVLEQEITHQFLSQFMKCSKVVVRIDLIRWYGVANSARILREMPEESLSH